MLIKIIRRIVGKGEKSHFKNRDMLGVNKARNKWKNSGEITAIEMRNENDHSKENLDGQHRKDLRAADFFPGYTALL